MTAEDRIEYLRRMVAAAKKEGAPTHQIRWKGQDTPLAIIRVDVNFLRYRLENGRTKRMQLEYLEDPRNVEVPKTLFQDAESKAAQSAQHEILKSIIRDKGLDRDLRQEHQREPAIVTYDGFVLNGNRRLAALREAKDQYMNCVVLPETAEPRDLYRLELDLQMAADTKMAYTWVDELLHIRHGLKVIHETEKDVARAMRIDLAELRRRERMLEYVDWYLRWSGSENQYHLVGDSKQAFTQIETHACKIQKKDPGKHELFCGMAFELVKEPPDKTRLYDHINALAKEFEEVSLKFMNKRIGNQVAAEKCADVADEATDGSTVVPKTGSGMLASETASPLDVLAGMGDNTKGNSKNALTYNLSHFSSYEKAKGSTKELMASIEDAKTESKEKRDKNEALRLVTVAHEKLQSVEIETDVAGVKEIEKTLARIVTLSEKLLRKLKKING